MLELFFRFIIPASEQPNGYFDSNDKIYVYSNELEKGLYTKGKFAEIKSKWRINNMGWNYPIDYYRVENKKLIAVIGDSYVEAFQVDADKNYPYLLREKLGKHYEVFAFGMSGAPLSQYLHISRYVNKHLNPEVLIFNVVHNDFNESILELFPEVDYFLQVSIKENGSVRETIPQPNYSFAQYSPLKRLLYRSAFVRYLWSNLKVNNTVKDFFKNNEDQYESNIKVTDVIENRGKIIKATDYLIKTIHKENRDKRIIFIFDAPRKAIYNNSLNESNVRWLNEMMEASCKKYSVGYIDLTQLIQKDYKANNIKFNSEFDYHWNEYGHEFVASVLHEYLRNNKTID